jgi:hypothetical protein
MGLRRWAALNFKYYLKSKLILKKNIYFDC